MTLQTGDTLLGGQYRILRVLGRGGFGRVYQAKDTLLDDVVAIKELIPSWIDDEEVLRRFLVEAKATMRLAHKRIVRTHNVFSEGENYYIVMEYMAGGTLETLLQEKGSLSVGDSVDIAAQVCHGLGHAHEEGIVHCDLKPGNILFDADGSAKVADFGIAHVSPEALTRTWQTRTDFVVGTLPYMSPEQADGVRDDPRVDIYAVGAMLYRMLTGRAYMDFDPTETPRAQAINVRRILSEEPLPPSTHNPRIPAWLDQVVLRTLAKQPEDRYSDATELLAALRQDQVAAVLDPPAPLPQAAPASSRLRSTPVWPLVLGGVALVAAIVIGLIALLGGGDGAGSISSDTVTPSMVQAVAMTEPTETNGPIPTSPPTGSVQAGAPNTPRPTDAVVAAPTDLPRLSPAPPTASPMPDPATEIPVSDLWAKNYVGAAESGGVTVELARVLVGYKSALPEHDWDVFNEYLEGWEEIDVVGELIFKVTNNTDSTVGIYPDQGSVQIGGEQIELLDYMFATSFGDTVGGDLHPGVTKIGGLWFGIRRYTPEEIDSVTFRCAGPIDLESYQPLGPRIEIPVVFPVHVYEALPEEFNDPRPVEPDEPLEPTETPIPTDTLLPTDPPLPTNTLPPTITPEPPEPVVFLDLQGKGSTVTENFDAPECEKAVFPWSAKIGDAGFAALIATVHEADSDREYPVANAMGMDEGGISGQSWQRLAGGSYFVTIENSTGPWSLNGICLDDQPPVGEGVDLKGERDTVTDNYHLHSCRKSVFHWSVEAGTSDFAALIVSMVQPGSWFETELVNEMAMDVPALDGESFASVDEGTYYFYVWNTTGPWTLRWECQD